MLSRTCSDKSLKEQLKEIIKKDITEETYQPGDMLPREVDYQERYEISRITVRSAMGELESEGYIERIKGKGTFVRRSKIVEPLLKIEGFTEEMAQKGLVPETKDAHMMITKADKACSDALGIEIGTPIYELTRVRWINNIPVALFKTYIKYEIPMSLEDKDYEGSLYQYLKEKQGLTIQKIKQSISATIADERMVDVLECNPSEAILILKRIGYSQGFEEPIEYTIAKYVGSRYEYYFELER